MYSTATTRVYAKHMLSGEMDEHLGSHWTAGHSQAQPCIFIVQSRQRYDDGETKHILSIFNIFEIWLSTFYYARTTRK